MNFPTIRVYPIVKLGSSYSTITDYGGRRAKSKIKDRINDLEQKLDYTKENDIDLVVGDTNLVDFLIAQIEIEKENLENFRIYSQPRRDYYKDLVE